VSDLSYVIDMFESLLMAVYRQKEAFTVDYFSAAGYEDN